MSAALLSAVALLAAPPFEQQQTLERPGKIDAPAHSSAAAEPRPIIFIAIAKTGGTSIGVSLGMESTYSSTGMEVDASVAECDAVPWINRHEKHDPAAVARTYYNDSEWERAYKISFVRNPWERLVSSWAMKTDVSGTDQNCSSSLPASRTQDSSMGAFCADPKPCDESISASDPSVALDDVYSCSFTCWFENACYYETEDAVLYNVEQLGYFVKPEVLARAHASNARRLLEENSMVDFIGRQENLTSHLYLALLGAGNNESVASACANNLADVVEGSAGHDAYELYYADAPLRRLAEETYAVDDAVFNYTFGVPGPYDVPYQRD